MKVYSINVGVSIADTIHYGKDMGLKGPDNDAWELGKLAIAYGAKKTDVYQHINHNATYQNFIASFRRIIDQMKTEHTVCYLILSFSGHGAKHKIGFGPNDFIELVCFYDQMVLENVIRGEISKLPNFAHCFIIFDSCYANGIAQEEAKILDQPRVKSLNPKEVQKIISTHPEIYKTAVSNYDTNKFKLGENVCAFSACGKSEKTFEADREDLNSYFSDAVIQNLEKFLKQHKVNYLEFSSKVKGAHESSIMSKQKRNPFFQSTAPFYPHKIN